MTRRQQRTLHGDGEHDDDGGHEDDEVAQGEVVAAGDGQGNREGRRERDCAAESGEGVHQERAVRRRAASAGRAAGRRCGGCPVTTNVKTSRTTMSASQMMTPSRMPKPRSRAGRSRSDHLQLQADEHEQGAVEHVGRQRPERPHLVARLGAGDAGPAPAHQQAADDDGEDSRGVHQFGGEERQERRHDHADIARERVRDAAQHSAEEAHEQADRDPSDVGDDQLPRDR